MNKELSSADQQLHCFLRSHWLDYCSIQVIAKCALKLAFVTFRTLLNEEELKQLEDACDMALELNQSKHKIYEYVESRMSFIAPNLSIIVGASTAAKIMGERGKKKNPDSTILSTKYSVINLLALCSLSRCRYCWWPY